MNHFLFPAWLFILLIVVLLKLTAFASADETDPAMLVDAAYSAPIAASRITGPTQGLHPALVRRLDRMSRHFGATVQITPNGGCRPHGSRAAPRSQHRVAVGCKAADVTMDGVSRVSILRYWRANGGGGCGYYCNKPFVHVDIASSRTWAWNCGRNRRDYLI